MPTDLASNRTATLQTLAGRLDAVAADWQIIGGAALVLHGVSDGPLSDIDVLIDPPGAMRLMRLHGLENQADHQSARFRSDWLLRPDWPGVATEIMAGFQIHSAAGWQPVQLPAPLSLDMQGTVLRVATRPALRALLLRCGRPKDLARVALLDALPG